LYEGLKNILSISIAIRTRSAFQIEIKLCKYFSVRHKTSDWKTSDSKRSNVSIVSARKVIVHTGF